MTDNLNADKPKTDKSGTNWKTIVTVASLTLTVLTVIAAYLQLIPVFQKDGPRFAISTQYGPFALPPDAIDFKIIGVAPEIELKDIKSYCVITITNSGNQRASNVRLQTKTKGTARYVWDDEKNASAFFNNDVPIDPIEIKKTLALHLWTVDEITSATTMSLIHNNGDAQVKFLKPPSDTNWTTLISNYVWMGALIYFVVAIRRLNKDFADRAKERNKEPEQRPIR